MCQRLVLFIVVAIVAVAVAVVAAVVVAVVVVAVVAAGKCQFFAPFCWSCLLLETWISDVFSFSDF